MVSSSIASISKCFLGILALEKNHVLLHINNLVVQKSLLHHQPRQIMLSHLSFFSNIFPLCVPYQNIIHILPHNFLFYVVDYT
jgi:hypothetical protein